MKKTLIASMTLFVICSSTHANIRPVISIGAGIDNAQVSQSQDIVLFSPFFNTYASTSPRDNEVVGGIFLGGEMNLYQNWLWQFGVSYYKNQNFVVNGEVWQFGIPTFNNLGYQYQISSHRYLFETKLLATCGLFHPFVVAGIGSVTNKAYGYSETPLDSFAVPLPIGFSNNTNRGFTYLIGLGVDYDLTTHVRIGAAYRYADLGKAGLGTTPLQENTTTITNQLNTNELLFQFTYLA